MPTLSATQISRAEMEILNLVKDDFATAGCPLIVQEFMDYVTLNDVLESAKIDANFYQLLPYMEAANAKKASSWQARRASA